MTSRILLVVFGAVIIFLLYWKGCGNSVNNRPLEIITSDTVYTQGKADTVIKIRDTVIYRDRLIAIATIPITDNDGLFNDTIRAYNEFYEDSITEVTVSDTVSGHLLSQTVKIKSKSILINRVDTVTITNTVLAKRNYIAPFVFTQIGNEALGVGVIYNRSRTSFVGGYDVNNKNVLIGIGLRL